MTNLSCRAVLFVPTFSIIDLEMFLVAAMNDNMARWGNQYMPDCQLDAGIRHSSGCNVKGRSPNIDIFSNHK